MKKKRMKIIVQIMAAVYFAGGLVPVSLAAPDTELIYLSGKGPSDAVKWNFFCSDGRNSGNWTLPEPKTSN